jgi:anti-sigma-K factor RskA
MKSPEDNIWQSLLVQSAPTFAGDLQPPFGFVAATLAALRAQARQQAELERVGWRALAGALMTLTAVITLTIGLQMHDRNDPDPAVQRMVEIDHIAVS